MWDSLELLESFVPFTHCLHPAIKVYLIQGLAQVLESLINYREYMRGCNAPRLSCTA